MYQLIGTLIDLGMVASALLGVVAVARRVVIRRRTRRWIKAIEQGDIVEDLLSLLEPPGTGTPVEIWDHVVQFYGQDGELVDAVSDYVSAAIGACEAALVVATPEHRQALDEALVGSGTDVASARADGRYIALDAAGTMAKLVVDGHVDRGLFRAVVGEQVRALAAPGRPVRVYGEMVALLWDAGQVNAAIDLEGLWNELGSVLPFSLYCAYPTHPVTGAAQRARLEAVGDLHAGVAGPEGTPTTTRATSTGRSRSHDEPRT